jgi:serine/threonine-protein kinase
MSLAEQPQPRPRPRIGRYAVVGRIGQGGMGMVYRGLDETLDREVAVKTLTVEGTLDDESRQRFEIEAKAAARLQHSNIVTVYELGEDRGVPFIAMELLPGTDLESLIRTPEAMLLQEKLEVIIQVLRGLAFAHEHGIVHRDIKPSNIRLLDDGTAKILDFGIAKLGATSVTRTGMMVGTVYYMSPEQIRGKRLDGRSDVFSAGVILYELLSGHRPFTGNGSAEVLFKIVNEEPAPLPDDLGPATERLQRIVTRALAKDREKRYPSATAMADGVAEVLATLSVPPTAAEVESVGRCRALIRSGNLDEGTRELRELLARTPGSVEARRALRAATREIQQRQQPCPGDEADYPELDATFQASPTRREPATAVQAATVTQAPEARPAGGRLLLAAAGLGLLAALASGALLLWGGKWLAPVASPPLHLTVRSSPAGAEVLVNGQPSGVTTDGELTVPAPRSGELQLGFRKPGYQEISLPLRAPFGPAVSVTLTPEPVRILVVSQPPGASVSLEGKALAGVTPLEVEVASAREQALEVRLDGYEPQEVRLVPGEINDRVELSLQPVRPPGRLRVVADYPVDVIRGGETLARAQATASVSLPAGRQKVRLVSRKYFLDQRSTVQVPAGGETTLRLPQLGTISIRAIPDNCKVLIDGRFVDYPPILERQIVSGRHQVGFRWPDGTRRDGTVEVPAGGIAYQMGRKD